MVLFGTGKESRDFIHISDILFAIDCVITNGTFNNDIINVANGKELSIKSVADLFYEIYNSSDITVGFGGEERKGDPVNWCADIGLLRDLKYIQKVTLKEGLEHYIKWLKENV